MTNVIPFPGRAAIAVSVRPKGEEAASRLYDFTAEEVLHLYRWYSAMKYAFPRIEGVMTICHKTKVSAVGLYGAAGTTPSCLISKHENDGRSYLLWSTDQDPPRVIRSIPEITEPQIGAIDPPRDERRWLDAAGWMSILSGRTTSQPAQAL
jgi:hypothetical protein